MAPQHRADEETGLVHRKSNAISGDRSALHLKQLSTESEQALGQPSTIHPLPLARRIYTPLLTQRNIRAERVAQYANSPPRSKAAVHQGLKVSWTSA